jgi:hypothetical protein
VRHIRRYFLLSVGVLLALLWLGLIALWIRSYWQGDVIAFETTRRLPPRDDGAERQLLRDYLIMSGRGGIALGMRQIDGVGSPAQREPVWQRTADPQYPKPWTPAFTWLTITGSLTVTNTTGPGITGSAVRLASPNLKVVTNGAPIQIGGANNSGTETSSGSSRGASTGVVTIAPSTAPAAIGGANVTIPVEQASAQITLGGTTTVANVQGGVLGTGAGGTGALFLLAPWPPALAPPANPPTGPYQFLAYSVGTTGERTRVVIFPFWLAVLLMAMPTAWALLAESRARRRRWRARHGCCNNCGYDLRASPERCPECGTFSTSFSQA